MRIRSEAGAERQIPIGHSSVCGEPTPSTIGFISVGMPLLNQPEMVLSGGPKVMARRNLT